MNATTLSNRWNFAVIARHAARALLGLLFVFASATYFLNLTPPPPELQGAAGAFTNGLGAAGYFMPLLKGTELICGLLLLSNRFVPLALVVLAPIVVNIVAVHAFLMPEGLPMAIVVAILHGALGFAYRQSFAPLLTARCQ
ncbi:MAG: DoxX family membrane protein [Archangium sp.]